MIKGLIFDLDGTLIDSMHVWEEVDRQFFKRHGFSYDEHFVASLAGLSLSACADRFIDYFQLEMTKTELIKEWQQMAYEQYAFHISENPGVRAFLQSVEQLPKIIATSNNLLLSEMCLQQLDLIRYFQEIVSYQQLNCSKDQPFIYQYAAERLDLKPEECMVFEDLQLPMQIAKQAGFKVIGVGEHCDFCDLSIRDFNDLLGEKWERVSR